MKLLDFLTSLFEKKDKFHVVAFELNRKSLRKINPLKTTYEIDGITYLPNPDELQEVKYLLEAGELEEDEVKDYLAGCMN